MQFTPQQLLDSGRRAEGVGKLELAHKFYRHLTDNYAPTAEAAEARNRLGRIVGPAPSPVWQSASAHGQAQQHVLRSPQKQFRLPQHRDHYRVGRVLAGLMSGFGWLAVAGAVLGLMLVAGAQLKIGPLPQLKPQALGLSQALGGLVGGTLLVFFGQMARALFDQANATRELVAIERAKQSGGS